VGRGKAKCRRGRIVSSNMLAISTTIIGLAISGLGLIFLAIQVRLARRQLRGNMELANKEALRVKRQATIDFYMSTMERVGEWRTKLPDDWDGAKIADYTRAAYGRRGEPKRLVLASYLAYFEALAVAIRRGIYDLSVLDSIAGSRVLNICQNYRNFFLARREEVGSDLAYRNLEWLAAEIKRIRSMADYRHV
jgi:hypothetical protein